MTPEPDDPAVAESGTAAVEMRQATERLREQAWMVAGVTRPAPGASDEDALDAEQDSAR